jgi:hypothetical protein
LCDASDYAVGAVLG